MITMPMRMPATGMVVVGYDEYDVDEAIGEDDAPGKDNHEYDMTRRLTYFVRLLAQLPK